MGNGNTANQLVPVGVTGLASGVSAIAAGYQHTCALTSAGGVMCWGSTSSSNSATARSRTGTAPGAGNRPRERRHGDHRGHLQPTCALVSGGAVKLLGLCRIQQQDTTPGDWPDGRGDGNLGGRLLGLRRHGRRRASLLGR